MQAYLVNTLVVAVQLWPSTLLCPSQEVLHPLAREEQALPE
jgi:hypothetical protein